MAWATAATASRQPASSILASTGCGASSRLLGRVGVGAEDHGERERWLEADEMRDVLSRLPTTARSGDVYAMRADAIAH
jgi:hypothetical protein